MEENKLAEWIKELIAKKELWKFYKSNLWQGGKGVKGVKNEVLEEQHYECQECLKQGKIKKADTVHHVQFVRKYPGLALSKYYTYKGKQYRNLVAVCKECHNKLHPEKHFKKKKQLNVEKW